MKVAPKKNFITKIFSESRCEWLCIGDFFFNKFKFITWTSHLKQKEKKEKIIMVNVPCSRVIKKKQNLLSFKLLKDKRMVIKLL